MPKAIVTQELVSEIAEAFVAAGEEPSIIVVQGRIGAGSYTTIKRYLDIWKQQRKSLPPPIEVPSSVVTQSQNFAQVVWQAATTLTEQRIAEIRNSSEQQLNACNEHLRHTEEVISQLEQDVDTLTRQLEEANQALVISQQELEQALVAQQAAEVQISEISGQLSLLQRQNERLADELAETRATLLQQAKLQGEVDALRRLVQEQLTIIMRINPPEAPEN